jgi:lipoyl(octanoyl) transferase
MNKTYNKNVELQDWDLMDYEQAWARQIELHKGLISDKRDKIKSTYDGFLVLCEHPPVYTLGKSGKESHLLLGENELAQKGIDFYKINRGGDITHHGPGQIVGYPILNLDAWYHDVHKYVRNIEEWIISTLATFDITAGRNEGYTGVWINDLKGKRKICAIGIHMSRWVSMHGFALNVNNDLALFNHIIPCGIQEKDKSVTSIENELGRHVEVGTVKEILQQQFIRIFETNLIG